MPSIAQEQPPSLPPDQEETVVDIFQNNGIDPAVIIVIDPTGVHEIFELQKYPLVRSGPIEVSDLALPDLTHQPLGSGVICGKYGCVKY
jgi:hypothetical protein